MKKLIVLGLVLVCVLGFAGCSAKIYKGTDELMDRADNVAIVNWNQGYVFLINSPEIAIVQMTLQNGDMVEEILQKDSRMEHC